MAKKIFSMFIITFGLIVLAACSTEAEEPAPAPVEQNPAPEVETPEEEALNIPQTAIAADDFNILVDALVAADLVGALEADGPFTVFAPNDQAFEDALVALDLTKAELLALDTLPDILLYHVVAGNIMAEDVLALAADGPVEVETLLGENLTVRVDDGALFVNDIQVIMTDIEASNGVIHVIEGVILPPEEEALNIPQTAIAADDFNILVDALVAADLVGALEAEGPFTVFAPNDQAFEDALVALDLTKAELLALDTLPDILLYHVVAGNIMAEDVLALAADGPVEVETLLGENLTIRVDDGAVFVNDIQVIMTDIEASNGVIHVVEGVILPPEEEALNIPQTAIAADDFNILVDALVAADLVGALEAEGPFTVFAPNDQAFEDALVALDLTKAELLALETLPDILLYHVVAGNIMAEDVLALAADGPVEVETLLGENLTIRVDDGAVFVNDIQVIMTDIEASNGVIHVIEGVILPPQ